MFVPSPKFEEVFILTSLPTQNMLYASKQHLATS
jgi:hypothetical protein